MLKLPSNIPPLYATEKVDTDDKVMYARLFALNSAATWLVAEFDPEEGVIYGYCDLYGQGREGGAEWGYTSLAELESLKFMGIPRVEVDAHFTPKTFKECISPDGRI